MLQGICFDLDGTLGGYAGDFAELLAFAAELLVSGEERRGEFLERLPPELARDGPLTAALAAERALSAAKLPVPADLKARAARVTDAYASRVEPAPGAGELLERLDRAGVKLALVSNGPRDMQLAALRALGFERHFRAVLISGDPDVASRKPAPRIFGLACTGLESLPERTLMVGDDLENDVRGALAYGMRAVHLSEGGAPLMEGAERARDLTELSGMLKERYAL